MGNEDPLESLPLSRIDGVYHRRAQIYFPRCARSSKNALAVTLLDECPVPFHAALRRFLGDR